MTTADKKKHLIKLMFVPNVSPYAGQTCLFQTCHLYNEDKVNLLAETKLSGTSFPKYKKFIENFIRVPDEIKLSTGIKNIFKTGNSFMGELSPENRKKLIAAFFDDANNHEMLLEFAKTELFKDVKAKTDKIEFAKQADGSDMELSTRLKENLTVILNFLFEKGSYFYIDGKRYRINGYNYIGEPKFDPLPDPFKYILPDMEDEYGKTFDETDVLAAARDAVAKRTHGGAGDPSSVSGDAKKKEDLFFSTATKDELLKKLLAEKKLTASDYRKSRKAFVDKINERHNIYEIKIELECLEEHDKVVGDCKQKLVKYRKLLAAWEKQNGKRDLFVKHSKRYVIIPFKAFVDTSPKTAGFTTRRRNKHRRRHKSKRLTTKRRRLSRLRIK